MKNLLWVSALVPYDTVGHAGGKIHNYYLKYLKKNSDYNIKLVSFYRENEVEKIDLDKYEIDSVLLKRCIFGFPRTLINLESFFNPYNRYAGIDQNYTVYQLKRALKRIRNEGFEPQIIILQWTEIVVLIDIVKDIFPNAKVIGIEEDVKFLNFERNYKNASNNIIRWLRKVKYDRLRKIELEACNNSDIVILNNTKDYNLLIENKIEASKLYVWQPYFENKVEYPYQGNSKNIIFYGAMSRDENWKSAIWFIENVFYKLEDQTMQFLIIGGNPPPQLLKYSSERLKVLGYVDDIGPYFQEGICLVAPLLLGAGIKIKVLEAMSAGIPVLTNEIGIEGIPAVAEQDYLHCENAEEYILEINKLLVSETYRQELSRNGKLFINKCFNLKDSAENFIELLNDIKR